MQQGQRVLLDGRQPLAVFRGQRALKRGQILGLLDDQLFERPDVSGQHDRTGQLGVPRGNARHHVTALAMAKDKDAAGIDVLLAPQQSGGPQRVLHRLLRHGETRIGGALVWVDLGALLIAQHGDSAGGQAFREVPEDLRGAHRLVAVVGTGAVHQHQRRERPFPVRHRQRGRQLPLVGAHRDLALGEGIRRAVWRTLPCRRWRRREPRARYLAGLVPLHREIQGGRRPVEGNGHQGLIAPGLDPRLLRAFQRAEGPDLRRLRLVRFERDGPFHFRRESGVDLVVMLSEELVEHLAGEGRRRWRLREGPGSE